MILTERDKDLIARVVRWEQQHGYVPASEAERRRTALQASILIEGSEGGDDQLAQMRPPDGWREANGDYTHPAHGTVHINGDRWLHRKDNKIIKSGSGRTSLVGHLKEFSTGDTGPAGTASETTESQHEVLRRALVGGPARPSACRKGCTSTSLAHCEVTSHGAAHADQDPHGGGASGRRRHQRAVRAADASRTSPDTSHEPSPSGAAARRGSTCGTSTDQPNAHRVRGHGRTATAMVLLTTPGRARPAPLAAIPRSRGYPCSTRPSHRDGPGRYRTRTAPTRPGPSGTRGARHSPSPCDNRGGSQRDSS